MSRIPTPMTRCILCLPVNLVARPFRKLSVYVASLSFHARMFRLVAKTGPVAWLASLLVLEIFSYCWVHENIADPTLQIALYGVGLCLLLWLSLCWCVVPDADNRGILCNIKPGRALSAHIEGNMSAIDLPKGCASTLNLARQIGAKQINLYSPLFGKPEKERIWLSWFEKELGRLAPGAIVEVAHRKPISRYVALTYRCLYGENARDSVKDGRVQAACFRITGF